ncbi:MAG TPA: IS5 family transposase [Bacillales bacterium]
MYQHHQNQLVLPDDFFLPFGGKLNKNNRWVTLAGLIPWSKVEEKYAESFQSTFKGQKAVSVRTALGSLIIKERLGLSDRETVQQITENPYLQYFIGLPRFTEEAPFHHSLMTHFRKRLGKDIINEVNEWIVQGESNSQDDANDNDDPPSHGGPSAEPPSEGRTSETVTHQGKLLLDATCAPADIRYPTDLSLLNEGREKLEHIIDVLHAPHRGIERKPRTYRQKAHKEYLKIAKQRRPKPRKIRKAVGQQLRFVKRDLNIISDLAEKTPLTELSHQEYRELLVIGELYQQQEEMFDNRSHRIDHRIVSISQPHVRPIVRGKTQTPVEFGAKVAASVVDGYAMMEKLEWDNYNEALSLQESAEAYRERYGVYPIAILADQIYRNRDNRRYCKDRGIRLSGPPLGRPSKSQQEQAEQKQLAKQDAAERNEIEGIFGKGKRHRGLGLIQACLQETSETVIALQFLVMNLDRKLRFLFWIFARCLFKIRLELIPAL